MENMDMYYTQYLGEDNTSAGETYSGTSYYDPCSYYPYYPQTYIYPSYIVENKIERAFEILKVIVREKIIGEPKSFDKFVKIVEKIAKVI